MKLCTFKRDGGIFIPSPSLFVHSHFVFHLLLLQEQNSQATNNHALDRISILSSIDSKVRAYIQWVYTTMTLNTLQYRLIVDSTLLLSPLSTYTRKLFKSLFLQKTTTTASYANKGLQPTAATLTSTSPSPARKLAPGKEFDGSYLHATIARKCNSCYNYDKNLTKLTCERGRSRSILGHFFCNNCEPPHDWHSSNICTELFLASNDRYRTILHAQQCRRCEAYVEPKVDKENYVKKVVSTLDLWTGRRKRLESTREFEETDLHDRERCHGCQTGVCNRRSED